MEQHPGYPYYGRPIMPEPIDQDKLAADRTEQDNVLNMPCMYLDSEHLRKIGEREPTFVLRAQDILAPDIIEAWAAHALVQGVSAAKCEHALLHAKAMRKWRGLKKLPD